MSEERETTTRWQGYSDYQSVSRRIAQSISDATEAYATIQRAHEEEARVSPDLASRAGSRIMSPALLLKQHMERDKDSVEQYQEILERWTEGDDDVDDGYLTLLQTVQLHKDCPDWLWQFIEDINTAGLELGYLAAGRKEKEEAPIDSEDEAVKEIFS